MFISPAFAQTASGVSVSGGLGGMILQMLLVVLIFYVLLIRPQQKRIKEHEAKVNALKRGDKIVTGGGIIATVEEVDDKEDELKVAISSGVVVRIARPTVRDVLSDVALASSSKAKKIK
ncbi:MAG: preprotein translocase subunit YajC [Alphaproteobacteria bacterium]|nr:preprotein translocase subunit YajC [Alphaproteobacteria bacterium]